MFGLLGKTLEHSFSPQIHAAFGMARYRLFEVKPEFLGAFLADRAVEGLNVTLPYKQSVLPYLDSLSPTAARIGAVNTVLRKSDGSLYGENTDYDGFAGTVRKSGIHFKGKTVLILGRGGAAKAAAAVCADFGAKKVFSLGHKEIADRIWRTQTALSSAQLLVQATPVGMYPLPAAVLDLDELPNVQAVFDLVYNPLKTRLFLQAEDKKIPAFSGLRMLVSQAARSAELFQNRSISREEAETVLENLQTQMQNIILIGMPGCGKSTVGAALAKMLGRPFADSDTAFEIRCGRTPAAWISEHGEADFRQKESIVLRELCQKQGIVLATGGGAVLQTENQLAMRQNGRIIFLNRKLSDLDTSGRPLAQTAEQTEKLWAVRAPIYRRLADAEICADGSISQVVKNCLEQAVCRK